MKIVEINVILLAEIKKYIHLIMATEKFGMKSHMRNINFKYICMYRNDDR